MGKFSKSPPVTGIILNIGGTLSALIRTESSSFQIPTSLTFTDLATQIENGTFQPISPDTPLQHLKSLNLPADSAKKWCQGQKIPLISPPTAETDAPSAFMILIPSALIFIAAFPSLS